MKKILLFVSALAVALSVRAQSQGVSAEQQALYISLVAPIAIEQQQVYGIPASITTAQGILESGWGQSTLALKANNHFGIKVTTDWYGEFVVYADDKPDDKFRKYDTAEESFVDHSLFLVSRAHYQKLFLLDTMDYVGWANGLYDAGYATDVMYAPNLIALIERYGLDRLDYENIPKEYQLTTTQPSTELIEHYGTLRRTGMKVTGVTNVSQLQKAVEAGTPIIPQTKQTASTQTQAVDRQQPQQVTPATPTDDGLLHYRVKRLDGRRYITAYRGDTYAVLARMLDISEAKLRQYNNNPQGQPRGGDLVFIAK